MTAVLIYRGLLLVRGCSVILEWFFGSGAQGRLASLISLHPYAALFGQATVVALFLIVFAGLWFFRRWARLVFAVMLAFGVTVFVIALAVLILAGRPYHPVNPIQTVFALIVNGAIIAMSFLPPVRDRFGDRT